MSIDRSRLPEETRTEEKQGFYAELAPDGSVRLFGYFVEGRPRGWLLCLAPSESRAEQVQPFTQEPELSFEEWAQGWIDRIVDEAPGRTLRCSFCQKTQQEVRKLIAGPTSYICDECVALCSEILAEEPA